MNSRISIAAILSLSFLFYGCVSNPTSDQPASAGQSAGSEEKATSSQGSGSVSLLTGGAMVKSVVVTLDESGLSSDRLSKAEAYDLVSRITQDIELRLQQNSSYDANNGGLALHLNVTAFRLRSGASAFWLGVMAGADIIAVDVDVKKGSKIVKSFKTDISTVLGGMALPAPTQRVNRMSKGLAIRVAKGL